MMQYRALRAGLLTLLAVSGSLVASEANAGLGACDRGYISEIVYSAEATVTKSPYPGSARVLYRVDSAGFTPSSVAQDNQKRVLLNQKYYSELYLEIYPEGTASQSIASGAADYDGKLQMLLSAFMSRTPVRIYSFGSTCSMSASEMEIVLCSAENSCEV